jgi:hypothetical protein
MTNYPKSPGARLPIALRAIENCKELIGTPEATIENIEKKIREITGDDEITYMMANYLFVELARKGIKEWQEEKINQLSTQ